MTASHPVPDAEIERPCYDPWGRTPHFELVPGRRRGVLYLPSRGGMWSAVGCTLKQARDALQVEIERRRNERRVTLRCQPSGQLADIDVEWTWDPALGAAHAYDSSTWPAWAEDDRTATALCGEVIGELRPPGHDVDNLRLEACGGCVRALSVRRTS